MVTRAAQCAKLVLTARSLYQHCYANRRPARGPRGPSVVSRLTGERCYYKGIYTLSTGIRVCEMKNDFTM